jgi:hypothetical protein
MTSWSDCWSLRGVHSLVMVDWEEKNWFKTNDKGLYADWLSTR